MIVPWAVCWSGEGKPWIDICPYTGERSLFKADRRGQGKPLYKEFHPNRQRQAVAECRCHICGGELANRTKLTMGLLEDGNVIDPFLCIPCTKLSLDQCPDLKIQIKRKEFRLREVTKWQWFPVYWDEEPSIIDGFAIRLDDFIDRDRDWLNGQVG